MTTPQPTPAGDLPPALAFVRAAIRRGLPETWTVAKTWQDPAGGWVIDLADETGRTVAQVALFDPPQAGQKDVTP